MHVLVTGGAGFIGSHVADALLAAGHTVTILDDLSRGSEANVPRGARFIRQDVTAESLAAEVRRLAPNAVCHLAAQIDVRRSVADPTADAHANILGTVRLLAAADDAKVHTFVFASTGGAIYGEQSRFPCDEAHPVAPVSPYGTSKRAAELYLDLYARGPTLRTVSLRLANVYGPRQHPHGEAGVVAIFCEALRQGRAPIINGDGEQTRDYVYVDDVAAAFRAAVENQELRDTYNVGTGVETSVNELARNLLAVSGATLTPQHVPGKPGEQRRSSIDAGRFRAAAGWQARVSLREGLAKTWASGGRA